MSGGLLAEVITVRRGNAVDELDAAKEFFFSADTVTAKHELRGPRTLEEVRQHLRWEVQLRLVQLEAFHFKVHVRTGSQEIGHLLIPPSSSVEADNREFWKGTGQGDKKRRAADLLHPRIPAKVELDGEPPLLTKRVQGKELLLQGALVEIGKDRFDPDEDRRKALDEASQFLQTSVRSARVKPQQAIELAGRAGCLQGQRRDVLGPGHYERRGDLRPLYILLAELQRHLCRGWR